MQNPFNTCWFRARWSVTSRLVVTRSSLISGDGCLSCFLESLALSDILHGPSFTLHVSLSSHGYILRTLIHPSILFLLRACPHLLIIATLVGQRTPQWRSSSAASHSSRATRPVSNPRYTVFKLRYTKQQQSAKLQIS